MKRYQITLGSNNSFRIVIPDRQTRGGSIVISGLISPVYFGGDINLLLETLQSVMKTSITPSTNTFDAEILTSAVDAIQSMYPSIYSNDIEISMKSQELVDVYCDFQSMGLTINTAEANMRVFKTSYVSDWSPLIMGDMMDMIMDEMLFTEVV